MDSNVSNLTATSGYVGSRRITVIIQVVILFLTMVLALAYTALILARPAFRQNKLNWFIINVCVTSAWFCLMFISISFQPILSMDSSISCRVQGYLSDMAACQLMYSHCVVAISRLFTIVYANKHFFRSNVYIWACLGVGWLAAFLFALPYLFNDGFTCSVASRSTFLSYYTLITTLFLPIAIVTICNAQILLFVRQSTRRVHAAGAGGHVSHTRDVFLLKTMIGTFCAFIIGWTPAFVTEMFNQTDSIPAFLSICFQLMLPLSVLHDVILLIYTNQPVRLFLKQLFNRPGPVLPTNTNRAAHPPTVLNP